MNRRTLCIVALGLGLLAPASMTFAQDRQNNGDRGGRGNFDPARFQEEMLNRTKERLGATDEEWTILKPKIEKVMTAQRETMSGRFGGFGRGGRDGNSSQRSAAAQAASDLRDALENKDTPADQIVAKVKALRDARAKAKADLEAAQKDLQAVLTPRQEAVLVSAGTLE